MIRSMTVAEYKRRLKKMDWKDGFTTADYDTIIVALMLLEHLIGPKDRGAQRTVTLVKRKVELKEERMR